MPPGVTRIEPDHGLFPLSEQDVEIPCDISKLRLMTDGFPYCNGGPARWIAWRPNCCPESPKFRLVCDECRKKYLAWQAKQAYIYCGYCSKETGGFLDFSPLRGKS